jgi:hypothetical protein
VIRVVRRRQGIDAVQLRLSSEEVGECQAASISGGTLWALVVRVDSAASAAASGRNASRQGVVVSERAFGELLASLVTMGVVACGRSHGVGAVVAAPD